MHYAFAMLDNPPFILGFNCAEAKRLVLFGAQGLDVQALHTSLKHCRTCVLLREILFSIIAQSSYHWSLAALISQALVGLENDCRRRANTWWLLCILTLPPRPVPKSGSQSLWACSVILFCQPEPWLQRPLPIAASGVIEGRVYGLLPLPSAELCVDYVPECPCPMHSPIRARANMLTTSYVLTLNAAALRPSYLFCQYLTCTK